MAETVLFNLTVVCPVPCGLQCQEFDKKIIVRMVHRFVFERLNLVPDIGHA
jgi:hypothetical protein